MAIENSIVFSHVDKAYGKNEPVVKDLNLEIRKGERLILLGPSGCGKTTTLRMIAGFEEITRGELLMDGKVVNNLAPGERNIAMVFQSYALFPHLTVWENITFGLRLQKLPADEIEKRTRMAMEILHLEGYENKKTHELSGGQKQRVAAARSLISNPDIILADEPTGALDTKAARLLMEKLLEINQKHGRTILMVTHDPNAASFCSRILFIQDGVIFHELRRKIPAETREEFYARILQVMAQLGGGSANVL